MQISKKIIQAQVAAAIRRIKKHKPHTQLGFQNMGFQLKYIGEGCFRQAFRIVGLPLVVKFPLVEGRDASNTSVTSGKRHTNAEVKKLKRLRRFKQMRPHLPKLYYHDRKYGIIIMTYYGRFGRTKTEHRYHTEAATVRMLGELIWNMTGIQMNDIDIGGNVQLGEDDKLKFVDLAY